MQLRQVAAPAQIAPRLSMRFLKCNLYPNEKDEIKWAFRREITGFRFAIRLYGNRLGQQEASFVAHRLLHIAPASHMLRLQVDLSR